MRAFIVSVIFNTVIAAHSSEYVMQLQIFLSPLKGVWVGVYQITNRGKDEEITHSTYLSRSIGEGIREEWNIYLSIRFRSRNGENVQLLGTFFPIIRNKMFKFSWNIYVPHQNRTYFWESTHKCFPFFPFKKLRLQNVRPNATEFCHQSAARATVFYPSGTFWFGIE